MTRQKNAAWTPSNMTSTRKVIVFLPAHNEEASIGEVLKRIPRRFDARVTVETLIIDDGSTDRTVERALAAGADHVLSLPVNGGLGAAVRHGLKESVRLGADVVIMIDADNEYPADQIPELLSPIFAGQADYTMGSRFMGTIDGMKLYRRLGNYFFTALQAILLRRIITDGQSGMRAFTRSAAEAAEIIHDYNYAQVLTLNLLRKGFRLAEIPIRYRFRTEGRSFISIAYIGKVLPAIWKELRRPVEIGKERDRADVSLPEYPLPKGEPALSAACSQRPAIS
ncbi:glycosyltransferase family 2 protein [Paenibacillus sp. YYML68]|uniref:glycosyltransferase family 2 protein n=1 Tax=Paenibacillus sp. YYML68 TaxID=2909250 RepID=UPI00249324C9|nr:glycosyltransferase family 2 protein [Paenibacillus sp. YYML68]